MISPVAIILRAGQYFVYKFHIFRYFDFDIPSNLMNFKKREKILLLFRLLAVLIISIELIQFNFMASLNIYIFLIIMIFTSIFSMLTYWAGGFYIKSVYFKIGKNGILKPHDGMINVRHTAKNMYSDLIYSLPLVSHSGARGLYISSHILGDKSDLAINRIGNVLLKKCDCEYGSFRVVDRKKISRLESFVFNILKIKTR